MQAIILAAGRGSRLGSALRGKPKCLAQLKNGPLIEYQLLLLRSFGISDVCVVLGYRAKEVRRVVGERCHYIVNERYAETNSLYSLSLTQNWVRGSFVLMNCDILAHPQIFRRLLATPGNVLAYDSRSGHQAEEMKVAFAEGKLQHISKAMAVREAHGESLGLLKFEGWAVKPFFDAVQAALTSEGENQWAPAAVQHLTRRYPLGGVDVAGLPWTEIDFPEDWQNALQRIWPHIRTALIPRQLKLMVASSGAWGNTPRLAGGTI
jgi:choline kinase